MEKGPIHPIDFTNPAETARHDRIAALVEQMLALQQSLSAARTPGEKMMLERQVEALDRHIDALVYEVYGLSQKEIEVVEGRA